jgi:hypothetical protein
MDPLYQQILLSAERNIEFAIAEGRLMAEADGLE